EPGPTGASPEDVDVGERDHGREGNQQPVPVTGLCYLVPRDLRERHQESRLADQFTLDLGNPERHDEVQRQRRDDEVEPSYAQRGDTDNDADQSGDHAGGGYGREEGPVPDGGEHSDSS